MVVFFEHSLLPGVRTPVKTATVSAPAARPPNMSLVESPTTTKFALTASSRRGGGGVVGGGDACVALVLSPLAASPSPIPPGRRKRPLPSSSPPPPLRDNLVLSSVSISPSYPPRDRAFIPCAATRNWNGCGLPNSV